MLKKVEDTQLNNYRIFSTDEFAKRLSKVTPREKKLIQKKLKNYIYPQLKEEPQYGNNIKKLVDYKPETWRYRLGKFRIFYIIDEDEKVIQLLSIDYRKDAYQNI